MKLIEYQYSDSNDPGWKFEKMELGKINLLVGQSAVGKSRVLNTITNLRNYIVGTGQINNGEWNIKFSHENLIYKWNIKARQKQIIEEILVVVKENNFEEVLIKRDVNSFVFLDTKLPKLDFDKLSVNILKNEDIISPIYNGFSRIYRRNFFGRELEHQTTVSEYNPTVEKEIETNPIALSELPVSTRLYYLKNKNKESYQYIVDYFLDIFPFIKEISFIDLREIGAGFPSKSILPLLSFKEAKSLNSIPFAELSSGMQKVLLIITDILSIPKQSVYLIDEYENSLGENAINFFPEFLIELTRENQYLITSHHPYLINTIPIEQWQVFQRKGQNVSIINGSKLQQKYGKSKQQAFSQLINDELYIDGVS